MVQDWLINRPVNNLIWDSVGNNPSLGDVIRKSHTNAGSDKVRQATFAYLLDRDYDAKQLPDNIKQLKLFRKGRSLGVPNVPINLLTSETLSENQWKQIAKNAGWNTIRNSLNTFYRHGVFKDKEIVKELAAKLSNKTLVLESKSFPYQLMTAYIAVSKDPAFPRELTNALQQAMEYSTQNVPTLAGQVDIFIDVSRSMHDPITGSRVGASTATRCIDVASMMASCLLRQNASARVTAFDGNVHQTNLNPFDSIMTNTQKLVNYGGGSTYCPGPMKVLNREKIKTDFIIYISDNESWINGTGGYTRTRREKATELANEWAAYKKNINSNARMVCMDLTPGSTTQVFDDKTIMNIGGFSDSAMISIANFLKGGRDHWANEIDKIKI
jgi:60 kDa SS-A/Ro ribonucleoprotein